MSNSSNSWFDDFLSTHQRPKQKEEAPAGVKPLPVVGEYKPVLKTMERDDGIFSMEAPKKKQTAPEETPAAVKPVFDRDQWLQDYAKKAERIFSPDQQNREEKKLEETPAPVQQSAPKTKEEWQALYDNSTKEMEQLESEWQELTDKMSGGMPSAEDQQRLDELQKQYKEAVTNRDAADNQLKQIGNNETTTKNLETLASWPEEDRNMLIQYAVNDQASRSPFGNNRMSENRVAEALAALRGKYDLETIRKLAESYNWYQNEVTTAQMQEQITNEVSGNVGASIGHSALTLASNVAGAVTSPFDYLNQVFGRTGQYRTLDPNAAGNLPNVYSSTVRQTVAKDIEGDGTSIGRKAASYLYQGGMSALDNSARLLASGGNPAIAATLAGLGTFGQTVSQASAQGATPAQAIAYGTVAAGIEALTEELSLDKLVKTAKGWHGPAHAIKEVFKQAGIEVSEEESGLIATTLMEMVILQEKASTNQRIQQLVTENGMSVEEANNQVMYELLGEAMDTAVVSAISGGLSSAGGSVVAYAGRDTGGAQTVQEGTEAAQSQETTVAEVTADTAADQQQTQTEEPQSNVRKAVQEFRDTGKVSNRMAEVILNDAESVAALQKETGMELPDTASGRRNAVKDAVEQLSRNEDAKDLTSSTAEALLRNQEQPQEAKAEDPEENRRLAIEATRELVGLPKQETVENVDTSQNGQSNQESGVMDHGAVGAADGDYGDNTVGSAESRFRHEVRRSKVYDNTYKNATSKRVREVGKKTQELDPNVAEYDYISEEESVYNALQRVGKTGTDSFDYSPEGIDAEYEYLVNKDGWTGEDNDTATLIQEYFMQTGDFEKLRAIAKAKRSNITAAAQLVQSQAKYTRPNTPQEAVTEAAAELAELGKDDVPKRLYKKQGFERWKNDITASIVGISKEIENIPDNDAASMRGIVRQLANFRRTTAWMGMSSNLTNAAERMLNKLDFKTAKDIAMTQLSMIPNDFRKRSMGQMVKTIRIQNMLSGLTTVLRNGVGNTSVALMDAVSDSTGGQFADMIMSKFTGIRTVSNETKYSKKYFNAAKSSAEMAALCVELDIPMDTEAAYSVGQTRNFSPQSGPVGRFMSAYEKYLKYALEVSDKFFEGGASGSVSQSIRDLGEKSGLKAKQIEELGEYVGKRRTYKEGRMFAKANTKLKGALNEIGTESVGAGDLLIPFAGVPGDVAQVGADYSGIGIFEGFAEIAKVISDKKAGKEVDPIRQRKAASDFGRGISGVGLIALSTTLAALGIIKVSDDPDKDERGLEQSLGLSGAQLNLSAAGRLVKRESTEWQAGDIVANIDFLEPFNSQMYIGYLMAQEESVADMAKAYPGASVRGVLQSVLDMPMMTTFADIAEIVSSLGEVSEDGNFDAVWDAVGQLGGDIATGFIPSWFRQVAQYIDPYYRDTSGDNALEKAWNRFLSAVPFASKSLPVKYSGLGEAQRRYENPLLGFFNTFINPGSITKIRGSEIADYLEALDDVSVYPEYMAPNSITVDGEKIQISGKEMTEKYQRTYGENISSLYGALISNPDFDSLPKEMKIEALKKARGYATEFAKAAVSDFNDVQSGEPDSIAKGIIQDRVSAGFTESFSEMTEDWKNGGDGYGATEALNEAYSVYEGLSDDMRKTLRKEASGRVKDYLEARAAGIPTETFSQLYHVYYDINNSDLKPAAKAQKWSYELEKAEDRRDITNAQKNILKQNMAISTGFTLETEKFDSLIKSGISTDDSNRLTADISGIKPEAGYTSVRTVQKIETIARADYLTEAERVTAMKQYMDENQIQKMNAVMDRLDISASAFATLYRTYLEDDKKLEEIGKYMALGYSRQEAEAIYYIYHPKK